ncbi:uncharacterized protein LOC131052871 isoform X2 [Cryptomeria japonica]|uniref:uncharacterized protein LOC131052871 isoform X2 n=1 Tax=Cryptomeria japonica TaxID=3369 RepID=UPI0027DA0645|nr:uncharacterized protein LOC131052871 isoform X2 [Cryptomeria japonica]
MYYREVAFFLSEILLKGIVAVSHSHCRWLAATFPFTKRRERTTFKDWTCKTGLGVLGPAIFQVCKTPGDHRKSFKTPMEFAAAEEGERLQWIQFDLDGSLLWSRS